MKRSKSFTIFYILILIVFIISFSIALPILFRPFYYWQIEALAINKMTIPSLYRTLQIPEIKKVFDSLMNYLIGLGEYNVVPLASSEEGALHFVDVKNLFLLDIFALIITSGFIIIIQIFLKQNKYISFYKFNKRTPYLYVGCSLIVLALFVGIMVLFNFDTGFEVFHHIFFPGQDNWIFDPSLDEVILLLPAQFFANCAIFIVVSIVIFCLAFILYDVYVTSKTKNAPIKVVGIDIDGTLLTDDRKLLVETINSLKKASETVKIVIATGRPYSGIVPYLKDLNILNEDNYAICLNGSRIVNNAEGLVIEEEFLKLSEVLVLKEIADKHKIHTQLYVGDICYTEFHNDYSKLETIYNGLKVIKMPYEKLDNNSKISKFMYSDTPDKLLPLKKSLPESLLKRYNITFSAPHFLEILPKDINKGSALKALSEYLGYDYFNVMAIGDEENDISMLKYAKIKVAMRNASPALLQIANYITESNNENGVGKAIDKYINKEVLNEQEI
ncbi:MAG: TIGR01906 family membrane protein [Bacillales bacterium]|jgi:integral membrane protein (TIGR01906 family)|nr:TIGR01906 family membrane protein [Bacillales bacterium]